MLPNIISNTMGTNKTLLHNISLRDNLEATKYPITIGIMPMANIYGLKNMSVMSPPYPQIIKILRLEKLICGQQKMKGARAGTLLGKVNYVTLRMREICAYV